MPKDPDTEQWSSRWTEVLTLKAGIHLYGPRLTSADKIHHHILQHIKCFGLLEYNLHDLSSLRCHWVFASQKKVTVNFFKKKKICSWKQAFVYLLWKSNVSLGWAFYSTINRRLQKYANKHRARRKWLKQKLEWCVKQLYHSNLCTAAKWGIRQWTLPREWYVRQLNHNNLYTAAKQRIRQRALSRVWCFNNSFIEFWSLQLNVE